MSSTLGHNTAQYVAKVLPILFRELRCEDGGNRRNAAFCAGVFCQHAPEQMQAQLGQLLQVFLFATPFKKPLGNLWETFGSLRRTRLVFAYQLRSVRPVNQPTVCSSLRLLLPSSVHYQSYVMAKSSVVAAVYALL